MGDRMKIAKQCIRRGKARVAYLYILLLSLCFIMAIIIATTYQKIKAKTESCRMEIMNSAKINASELIIEYYGEEVLKSIQKAAHG